MLLLTCYISIGSYAFTTVNDVVIKKSMHSYEDTAIIKIPTSAALKCDSENFISTIKTERQFFEGDQVTIQLGYDGDNKTEFNGFVKRINIKSPLEIECEGFVYRLRRTKKFKKTWKKVQLKEILQMITEGTDIELSPDIQDTTLEPFVIDQLTGAEVLEVLKKQYYTVYFIDGNVLYVGLDMLAQKDKEIAYEFGWNTIDTDSLKFRLVEDTKAEIEVTYKAKNGKEEHITKTYGDGPDKIKVPDKLTLGKVSEEQLEMQVRAFAEKYRYTGYEGKITTFLIPVAQPGYKATVNDKKYPERKGSFIAESVEIKFGQGGGRRIVDLGRKVG